MTTIQKICNLFETRNKSKRSVLLELELSPTALSEWKKGKAKPTTEAIVKLARYFGVSTDYLLGLSEDGSQKNFNICDNQVAIGSQHSANRSTDTSLSEQETELVQIFGKCSEGQKLMLLGYAKTLIEDKK